MILVTAVYLPYGIFVTLCLHHLEVGITLGSTTNPRLKSPGRQRFINNHYILSLTVTSSYVLKYKQQNLCEDRVLQKEAIVLLRSSAERQVLVKST